MRTRVDMTLKEQKMDFLKSMYQRAEMQLRLQEIVEEFQIVANSYFLWGLVAYAAKNRGERTFPINTKSAKGSPFSVIPTLVW